MGSLYMYCYFLLINGLLNWYGLNDLDPFRALLSEVSIFLRGIVFYIGRKVD